MAGPAPSRIRRCRVAKETSFASVLAPSSFLDVRLREGSTVNPQVEMLRVDRTRQRTYDEAKRVLGPRSAEAEVQTFLAPPASGMPLDEAAAAPPAEPTFAVGVLLKALLGGYRAQIGDLESAANNSTTTDIYVSTDATRWAVGGLVGVPTGPGGSLEVRAVSAVDAATNKLTVREALSADPDGLKVYNAHCFYLADDPSETLQLIVEELERDNTWWLLGCQGRLSFGAGVAELLQVTASLRAATYQTDDEVVAAGGTSAGASLGAASYADGEPLPVMDGHVLLATGAAPRTFREAHPLDLSLELTWEMQPIRSPAGTETVRRWRLMPGDDFPVRLTLTLPSETDLLVAPGTGEGTAKTVEGWLQNRAEVSALIQVGNKPGKTAAFSLPRLQVLDVQPQDANGLHAVQVVFGALEGDLDSTTELGRSPLVIGLL